MKKRVLAFALVLCMLCTLAPFSVFASNAYYINGKNVHWDDFSSSPSECWAYANNVYNKIWGTKFSPYRGSSDDSLRNLSVSELTLTESHLRAYVSNAALGASLRICNSEYLDSSDGWGHSQIIVQKDSNGFTVFEGGLSASPYCREKYYTWSEYVNTGWLGGTYAYIKYIKWPGAGAYSGGTTPILTMSTGSGLTISSSKDITFSWTQGPSFITGYNLYIAKQIPGTVNYDFENSRIYLPGLSTTSYTVEKGGTLPAGAYAAYVQPWNQYTDEKGEISNFVYFVIRDDIIIGVNDPADNQTYDLSTNSEIRVRGFAVNTGKIVVTCYASIDNGDRIKLDVVSRPDVQSSSLYSYYCPSDMVGFIGYISVKGLSAGTHTVHIFAESATCSEETVVKVRIVSTHTHGYSSTAVAPTCTDQGYTLYLCSCGDTYKGNYVPALGHNFVAGRCTRCQAVDPNYQPSHEHSYSTAITKPSCTDKGFTTYTCSCGDSYKTDYVAALGHNYVGGVCTRCGADDPNYKPVRKNPFIDVSDTAVYFDAVLWAADTGITTGYGGGEFRPQLPCTRGQVVTFLWRAAGQPEPTGSNPFVDVENAGSCKPYYKAIVWAAEQGITTGLDATHFGPNNTVTRAQFVTFLWRYEGKPASNGSINGFADAAKIATPFRDAVAWAVEKGITTGYNDSTFRPTDTCTRWAVVLFMYRDLK